MIQKTVETSQLQFVDKPFHINRQSPDTPLTLLSGDLRWFLPHGKTQVIGLLHDLHTKVAADAAVEIEAFNAYAEVCNEQAQDDDHQQETLTASNAPTNAAIEDFAAKTESVAADISSLASQLALADSDLTAASAVTGKQAKDFSKSEAELLDVVDTLQRAISIILKETYILAEENRRCRLLTIPSSR